MFHVDDYYLFEEKANSAIPTRVPLSSFTDSSDLVADLLRDSDDKERGTRAGPTVELASNKSGLRLAFDSNRMLHKCYIPTLHTMSFLSNLAEHGAMFYSNSMSNAAKGARKKIHGGSGVRDNGDAYGPGSTYQMPLSSPRPLPEFCNLLFLTAAAFIEFHHVRTSLLNFFFFHL